MKHCLLVLTADKSTRERDNVKIGKGSKQQQKEMAMLTGTGSYIIQGTSMEVGN